MSAPVLVLVGPMGSGKTTVGELVARWLDVPHRDTDDDVVAAAGCPIPEIMATRGEATFRALERAAVRSAVARHRGVLSLGGGAVVDASTRALLAGLPVVMLSVDADVALARVGDGPGRPLLDGDAPGRWQALLDARRAAYTQVAVAEIDTTRRTPAEVARAVLAHLALPRARTVSGAGIDA